MRESRRGVPEEVAAINRSISKFFDQHDSEGRTIGRAKGVYAFFDYDGEPIYVGQTYESLRSRVGRHLTNQRTDPVAMSVLDPFEVAEIVVWPIYYGAGEPSQLNDVEFSVYAKAKRESLFKAVLNEKDIVGGHEVTLPESFRARIIPDEIFERRNHPDIRIARRALTIARLAQVISERDVSLGLRRTLLTQARRLEWLSRNRFEEFPGPILVEGRREETGEGPS